MLLPEHRQEARRLARQVKKALEAGVSTANFVVRCYAHLKDQVEAGVREELGEILTEEQLRRVRVIFVEFEALHHPVIRIQGPNQKRGGEQLG